MNPYENIDWMLGDEQIFKSKTMKKEFEIVMLPTDKQISIGMFGIFLNEITKILSCGVKTQEPVNMPEGNQNLYVLSDDVIKTGDWYITFVGGAAEGYPRQCEDTNWNFENCRKIIATTDGSLLIKINPTNTQSASLSKSYKLPNLPETLINGFVKSYNDKKPMTKICLEMVDNGEEEWHGSNEDGEPFWNEKIELKINPDNTVVVLN